MTNIYACPLPLRRVAWQARLFCCYLLALTLLAPAAIGQVTQTFSYTGAVQTFTVPSNATSIVITAVGAGGGASSVNTDVPGKGASVTGTLTVTPGAVLYIYVGGRGNAVTSSNVAGSGGFNGGGNGGFDAFGSTPVYHGGGGGGASDVRVGGTALTDRVIVAAGGGGAGPNGGTGGDGGITTGSDGVNSVSVTYAYGYGGTQNYGGSASRSDNSTPGALGQGGNAGTGQTLRVGSGGGGGGYYGGGGGSTPYNRINTFGSGGGGGSSYTTGLSDVTSQAGVNATDGTVSITYTAATLPVRFTDFAAKVQNCTAMLKWATATEKNSAYYRIERSTDATHFREIGRVDAAGNSALGRSYNFTDQSPMAGNNYYRIVQVDADNTTTITSVQSVRMDCSGMNIQLYPSATTTVTHLKGLTGTNVIRLYNMTGSTVLERKTNKSAEDLDLSALPPGIYQVQVASNNRVVFSSRVVKSH